MKRFTRIISMVLIFVVMASGMTFADTKAEATKESTSLEVKEVKATVPELKKAASYNYYKIKLTWDPIDGVDGYVVYRATSKNEKFKKCYTTSDEKKSMYINTGCTTGKHYYYKIRGYKEINGKTYYTKYSAVKSAYARPNKVSLDLSRTSYDEVTLNWKKVSGATGYRIYQKIDGGSWKHIKSTKNTSITLQEEECADYRVRAYRTVKGKRVYGLYSRVYTDFFFAGDFDEPVVDIPEIPSSGEKNDSAASDSNTDTEKNEPEKPATKTFYLDSYSAYIEKGESFRITATVKPAQNLTWSSSDKSVATVMEGKVTANALGSSKITVADENGNVRTCTVYVVESTTPTVSSYSLDDGNGNIKARIVNEETVQYYDNTKKRWTSFGPRIVIHTPTTYTYASAYYSFRSSDKSIVKVDENGNISVVGTGKATISLTPKNNAKAWAKNYTFNVSAEAYQTQKDIMFKFSSPVKMNLEAGTVKVSLYYADRTLAETEYLGITTSSSDETVATAVMNEWGQVTVTAHSGGTVKITATTKYGTSANFTMEVVDVAAEREKQVAKYFATINDGMSEYEKLHALCEYILHEYKYDATTGSSATSMFMYGSGDCWAYSGLVNYYCDQIGLESITYKEIWEGNVRHTTNRVKADGQWYYVDCSINRGTTYDLKKSSYTPE